MTDAPGQNVLNRTIAVQIDIPDEEAQRLELI